MVKKTITIFIFYSSCLFAQATITKSIGTASRDYSTITLWEAGEQGVLTTLNEIHKGECYNDAVFDETITIDGSTADATRYMILSVASGQRHNGTMPNGARISRSAAADPIIGVADPFTRIEWLGIEKSITTGTATGITLNESNLLIDRVIIWDIVTTSGGANSRAFRISAGTRTGLEIRNCIIFDITTSDGAARGILIESTGAHTVTVNNCTIYNVSETTTGSARGIEINNTNATITIKNTGIFTSGTADFTATAGTMNQSYNVSSDATASGTGSLTSKTASNQFVSLTADAEDFHLKTGADMIEAGNTVAGWAYDIDDNSRPQSTNWDMGADEFVSAAPAAGKKKSLPIWYH